MSNFLLKQGYPIFSPDFVSAQFSVRLKKMRKEKNFTQKEIAELLNVTVKTYRSWEKGDLPKVIDLFNLAAIFQCSVDYLLGLLSDEDRMIAFIKRNLPLSVEATNRLLLLGDIRCNAKSKENRFKAYYIGKILDYLINTEEGGYLLDELLQYLQSSKEKTLKTHTYTSFLYGKKRISTKEEKNEYLEDIEKSLEDMRSYFSRYDFILLKPNADGSYNIPPLD